MRKVSGEERRRWQECLRELWSAGAMTVVTLWYLRISCWYLVATVMLVVARDACVFKIATVVSRKSVAKSPSCAVFGARIHVESQSKAVSRRPNREYRRLVAVKGIEGDEHAAL